MWQVPRGQIYQEIRLGVANLSHPTRCSFQNWLPPRRNCLWTLMQKKPISRERAKQIVLTRAGCWLVVNHHFMSCFGEGVLTEAVWLNTSGVDRKFLLRFFRHSRQKTLNDFWRQKLTLYDNLRTIWKLDG